MLSSALEQLCCCCNMLEEFNCESGTYPSWLTLYCNEVNALISYRSWYVRVRFGMLECALISYRSWYVRVRFAFHGFVVQCLSAPLKSLQAPSLSFESPVVPAQYNAPN